MKSSLWRAEAPSNIALIKYMGKVGVGNIPSNPSLSFTLNHLRSTVEIEPSARVQWQPLDSTMKDLSEGGQQKFLRHFALLCEHWGISGDFCIRSANNFPADCGLASSASSFAALTLATYQLAKDRGQKNHDETIESLSSLSRLGSGSSCRSFFSPWAEWVGASASPVDLPYGDLMHDVIVVSRDKKSVSSSEAHRRVPTSDLFQGRAERAIQRLNALKDAFVAGSWNEAVDLCWVEFWEMHALFETSRPPFSYMTETSLRVLRFLRNEFESSGDGPLVTMDAGPNIHLLYRPDQRDLQNKTKGLMDGMVL